MTRKNQRDRSSKQIAVLTTLDPTIEIRLVLNTERPYYAEFVRMNMAALYLGDKHDDLLPGCWRYVVTFHIDDFDEWLAARRELAHQALLKTYQQLSLLDARMARTKQR